VRWNDAADRTHDDVLALMESSRHSVGRISDAVRTELADA
jgi:hypothetical protein